MAKSLEEVKKTRRRNSIIREVTGMKTSGNKNDEHKLQVRCVRWLRYNHSDLYKVLFAVPNGGIRDAVISAQLKAEGARAGVADLILLKANSKHGALCIEMKTPDGKQSAKQKEWQRDCETFGSGKYSICRSFEEFKQIIDDYINDRI